MNFKKLINGNLELKFFKFEDLNKLRVCDGSSVKENKFSY